MLLHNFDVENGWVNGKIGNIVQMEEDSIIVADVRDPRKTFCVTRITRTVPMSSYSRKQFPITLAWALTIHKVQGLTLDSISLYLSDYFAAGLLYVALTRVRRLQDVHLIPSDVTDLSNIKVPYDDDCLDWIKDFEDHIAVLKSFE